MKSVGFSAHCHENKHIQRGIVDWFPLWNEKNYLTWSIESVLLMVSGWWHWQHMKMESLLSGFCHWLALWSGAKHIRSPKLSLLDDNLDNIFLTVFPLLVYQDVEVQYVFEKTQKCDGCEHYKLCLKWLLDYTTQEFSGLVNLGVWICDFAAHRSFCCAGGRDL